MSSTLLHPRPDLDGSPDPLQGLKLQAPAKPKSYVDRPRLTARLDSGAALPLMLVCAPAGSGKTVAVSTWAATAGPETCVVWISAGVEDSTPARFWSLVVAGLRSHGAVGPGTVGDHAPDLTALAVALASSHREVILVLDDFEVTDPEVSDGLAFLLDHAAPHVHVVVISRAEPPLPLHRYRLTDSVAELRMTDLAFTAPEVARLAELSGLSLDPDATATLTSRTRGWAAGVRFAIIFLLGCDRPGEAVSALTGDTGNVAQYLTAEVVGRQPADVRELLLRLCVVDELRPGLVEELGGPAAGRWLASLAGSDLPVETVDAHPGWYRLHPLLRELLQAGLAARPSRERRRLHRRAAGWFATHGALRPAVELAVAVNAWREATSYVVEGLAIGEIVLDHDPVGLAGMLRLVPADLPDPAAAVVRAALALSDGDPDACAAELKRGRDALALAPSQDNRAAAVSADVLDAVRAELVLDSQAVMLAEHAEVGLDAQDPALLTAHPELGALVQATRGRALLRAGAVDEAQHALEAVVRVAAAPHCEQLAVSALAHLAFLAVDEGSLRRAHQLASEASAIATRSGVPVERRSPAPHVALAWTSVEQDDLRSGWEHLRSALRSRELPHDTTSSALCSLVHARLLRSGGKTAEAREVLESATAELVGTAGWLSAQLEMETLRLHVATNDGDAAAGLLDRMGVSSEATVVLARGVGALQRGDVPDLDALNLLVSGASTRRSRRTSVEAHLVISGAWLAAGDSRQGRTALARALRVSEPEGLRRPFRDAPAAVRRLLQSDSELEAHRWLAAAAGPRDHPVGPGPRSAIAGAGTPGYNGLVEPLTPKETEVLGHLSALLSTDEIAGAMFVSVNTVRTHVRGILRKLAVTRRADAVRRARALHLIES